MGGGLQPQCEYLRSLNPCKASRYVRPSTIYTDDTPLIKAIWVGIINICQIPPDFLNVCEGRGHKSEKKSDRSQPHGEMQVLCRKRGEECTGKKGKGLAGGEGRTFESEALDVDLTLRDPMSSRGGDGQVGGGMPLSDKFSCHSRLSDKFFLS